MPSSVRGVLVGEVDLGGVASFRFVGLELLATVDAWRDDEEGLEGDLESIRNILFVSGSVRTEMGEVWDGSRSGLRREVDRAEARGVVGGVPSSDTGCFSAAREEGESRDEGLD